VEIYGESDVIDRDLACLAKWSSLHHVSLGPPLTARALQYVGTCNHLKSLDLILQDLDDESLSLLVGLTNLTHLKIHAGSLSERGLGYIGQLRSLTNLTLLNIVPPVTDQGLAQLEGLEKLQYLELVGSRITDAGLVNLMPMKELRQLYIGGSAVGDHGLGTLAKLSSLEELSVSGTKVTSTGLLQLVKSKHLRWLDVRNTSVNRRDAEELQRSVPHLTILGDGWEVRGSGKGEEEGRR